MNELLDRYRRHCVQHGLSLREGARAGDILDFERTTNLKLPADHLQFLRHVDGMAHGEMDPLNYIRLWPTGELSRLSIELPEYSRTIANPDRAIVLADHLYWSLGYVAWLTDEAVPSTSVFLVGDGAPILIADSFQTFLSLFLENSERLLPRIPRAPDAL
jgi:hypothetical protein